MISKKQLELQFIAEETRAERLDRILSGRLGHKVKPASELLFDYEKASQHHKRVHARGLANSQTNTPEAAGGRLRGLRMNGRTNRGGNARAR